MLSQRVTVGFSVCCVTPLGEGSGSWCLVPPGFTPPAFPFSGSGVSFPVKSHNHEYHHVLGPGSPPTESLNLGVVSETLTPPAAHTRSWREAAAWTRAVLELVPAAASRFLDRSSTPLGVTHCSFGPPGDSGSIPFSVSHPFLPK